MTLHIARPIGTAEILLLMRNLSVTLKAGVPLTRALALFEEEASFHRAIIKHLRCTIESGHSLADAMKTSPRPFPSVAIHLVETGELSGTLQQSLEDIVQHLHKSQELRRKIHSAMLYPAFVLIAMVGLGLSIGILVLPQLIPLFESLDVTLPWTTRILLWIAKFFELYGIVFTIAIAAGLTGIAFLTRLDAVKPVLHRTLLFIPYMNKVQRTTAIAQLASTLGTLLRNGIPIQDAITATANATNNTVFRAILMRTLPGIEAGRTLSDGLEKGQPDFPQMATTLIAIGEETGTLGETLAYISTYYEGEAEYALKNMTTALEPLLLIGIGIIVGFTVLSIITPIYDITSSIA